MQATVTIEVHRLKIWQGLRGQIVIEGEDKRKSLYDFTIKGHPQHDLTPLGAEGDWSKFSLRITKGRGRRREVLVKQRGDQADGGLEIDYDAKPEQQLAAKLLYCQVGEALQQFFAKMVLLSLCSKDSLKAMTFTRVLKPACDQRSVTKQFDQVLEALLSWVTSSKPGRVPGFFNLKIIQMGLLTKCKVNFTLDSVILKKVNTILCLSH